MIYIDGIGLSFLIKEVKEKIVNYRLTKIYQYDRSSLSFFFGKNNLLFQVKDNSTIFYLKEEKDLNTDFQSKFLLSLKKHLLNSILINIRQEGFDRIVYFDFEKLNQFGDVEKFTLTMELMGKASNIFLTSADDEKIISALYFSSIDEGNRIIMTGAKAFPIPSTFWIKSCGDSNGKLSSSKYKGEIFFSSNGRVYLAPVIIILFPSSMEEK